MSPAKCDHCGTVRPHQAELYRDGEHYYLCHPDEGRDCYHEVIVYGHELGVLGDGPSDGLPFSEIGAVEGV